ncbi:isochorismatase family protein [Herbidospora sp. NEAU-GS84]|uniref:Isochorismatase family protein n=1 Tax=Herbidospora solisilvae TaxID=2696284 RepID=A0A7C9MZU5_9ACTN|nr:cysteine hydrolase [Herbidospora solisilvae]NAS22390.1 isochorismatase family protein [Herbidospora solisilvae]
MFDRSSVLVIIDAQNGFITEHSKPAISVIASLVDRWQASGGSVVFTRYINYDGSPYERLIRWSKVKSSPEIDIVPELLPMADKATAVLDKTIYSFFSEEGDRLAQEYGWKDFYVCGLDTESCVLKTVVDAFERDCTPWLIADASASHAGQAAHDAGIFVASRFVGKGQIITTTDIPWGTLMGIPEEVPN